MSPCIHISILLLSFFTILLTALNRHSIKCEVGKHNSILAISDHMFGYSWLAVFDSHNSVILPHSNLYLHSSLHFSSSSSSIFSLRDSISQPKGSIIHGWTLNENKSENLSSSFNFNKYSAYFLLFWSERCPIICVNSVMLLKFFFCILHNIYT